jgi:hypothetical protein
MARNRSEEAPEKKRNWFKQIWAAYKITRETDPAVTLWTFGSLALVIILSVIVAIILGATGTMGWVGAWVFMLTLGLPLALVVAMFVLVRRAEAAAYSRIAGKPGAALSAVGTVRTGSWTWEQEPVAFNPKTGELAYRGVGRGGVVVMTEGGSEQRAARLADSEVKRVRRVIPEAPVTIIRVGDDDGQVKLTKLSRHVTKMKPVLTKTETADVTKRLKTLGAKKQLPIPKGVDPFSARPDRKGMRGR